MKKFFLLIMMLIMSLPVWAKDISVVIEHPRKHNRLSIRNEIKCTEKCEWKSESKKTHSGTTTNKYLSQNIQDFVALVNKNQVPAEKKLQPRDIYVNVTVTDGKKTEKFQLGHAAAYKGEDLKKYSNLSGLISKIEFNLQQEKKRK